MATNSNTPGYTLQQAQRDIAALRGGLARTGVVQPSGYQGFRVISQPADYTTYTVTAGSVTQCSKAWNIPANDAQAGTQYRLTVAGTGTEATTNNNLVFQTFGGNFAQCTFNNIGASVSFGFRLVCEVTVISTGSSGTANYTIQGAAGGANIDAVSIVGFVNAGAFNTQASFSLAMGGWWNNNANSPTFTTHVSMLERLGP